MKSMIKWNWWVLDWGAGNVSWKQAEIISFLTCLNNLKGRGFHKKKKVCAYHLPRRKVEVPQPWVVHMCACLSLARSRRVRRGAVPSWAKLLPDPSVWQPHGKNMCPWHCISCSLRRLDWNRPRSRPSYCKPVHLYVSSWWRSPWAAWCGPGNLVPEKNMKIFKCSFIYDSISHSHNDKRKGYLDM